MEPATCNSQYASFAAFQQTPAKGSINYTNFDYPAFGSGVWVVGGTFGIAFERVPADGYPYHHTMTIDSITPVSTQSIAFTAHGTDPGGAPWNAQGTVTGAQVKFRVVYGSGYVAESEGTIDADGAISGTAQDSNSVVLAFSTDNGAAHEVFSYTAPVTCAVVDSSNATAKFGYTIPAGTPLVGTQVVIELFDGGTPGTNGDIWAHGVGDATSCVAPTASYAVTDGNLVVH